MKSLLRKITISLTRRKAFTLIELLIVVAIIGILAAIAVPNFLAARTRATVSRVYADMRNMSTAIGMYEADNGRSPIGSAEGLHLGIWTGETRIAWFGLTTPVAYINSIPLDPFAIMPSGIKLVASNAYAYMYNTNASPLERSGNMGLMREAGFIWYMFSAGPANTEAKAPWPDYLLAAHSPNYSGPYRPTDRVYEMSNGVKSDGWIVWTNKGIYP